MLASLDYSTFINLFNFRSFMRATVLFRDEIEKRIGEYEIVLSDLESRQVQKH
jgi:hypothetical protein